jgi:hypothetical protein
MAIWSMYCRVIWNILWPFVIFYVYGHLVYFFPFWYVVPRKNLATLSEKSMVFQNFASKSCSFGENQKIK